MSINRIIQGIPWGSKRTNRLALDFSRDFVSLFEYQSHGNWSCIGSAALSAPDFSKQIDGLRLEALVRDKHRSPVTLWLPEEQILFRQYDLMDRYGAAAKAEALRNIAADSPYEKEELTVSIASAFDGKPVPVLAALRQTVSEAMEYAERWGFVPGTVSTRAHADEMGSSDVSFVLQETISTRAGRMAMGTAVATGALLAVSIGGLGVYHVAAPVLIQPKTINSAVALTVPEIDGDLARSVGRGSLGPTWIGHAQRLGFQMASASANDGLDGALHQALPFNPDTPPPELVAPEMPAEMLIGAVSTPPERGRPGRLDRANQNGRARPHSAIVAALRESATAPGTDTAPVEEVTTAAASDASTDEADAAALTNVALQSSPERIRGQRTRVAADHLLIAAIDSTLSKADLLSRENTAAENSEDEGSLDATEFAPETFVEAPKQRPAELVAAIERETEAEVTPPEASPVARAQDEDNAEQPTEEIATAEAAPSTPIADVTPPQPRSANAAQETQLASIDPTALAAVSAPKPLIRPRNLISIKPRIESRSTKRERTISPSSVRVAARERGLELGKTSLIGVIEANNGRKALVRMPTGDFRKVERGDLLDGWRVGSVGRETLRLTRRGQNRTLLLVTR